MRALALDLGGSHATCAAVEDREVLAAETVSLEGATSALSEAAALDYQTLFALADAGDRVAREVRDRCRRVWAAGAVSLVHAYDPEVVVIGGGVMPSAAAVLPFVEGHVHRHAWTPWGRVEVRAAALGDRAGLLGAVPLLAGGGGGSF